MSKTVHEIDRWEGSVGWIAVPDEKLQRSSHALRHGEDLWLLDPVDTPDLDSFLSEFGTVVGVIVLLDRHLRDADTIADRHDVSIHRPPWMSSIDARCSVPVTSLADELGRTGYSLHKRIDLPFWKEAVLHRPDGVLYVPESLGTASHYCAPGERLGVHPMLRFTPPSELADLTVNRLLVGHGTGIHDNPAGAIETAITGSRRRALALYGKTLTELLR